MNDVQRRPYSYDDIFPERWLHAPDLDGKAVTLRIKEAYSEYIADPKNHKKDDPGDLCGIVAFHGTQREYVLSKQNAWILKTLWGKEPAEYVDKRITIAPVPDSSGFTEHGTRILFVGSPDVEHDLSLNLPGGRHLTFKKTVAGKQVVDEASVDAVTGEVAGEPAPEAGEAPEPDEEPAGVSAAANSAETLTEAESDEKFLGAVEGKASQAQRNRITALLKKSKLSPEEWQAYAEDIAGTTCPEDMSADKAALFIDFLSGKDGRLAV